MSDLKQIQKCIKAAQKRIPFASEKRQNEMLEFAAGSMSEAYRIGAEEAQQEILNRLRKIERETAGG
jgi:hypothetical protein